MKLFPIFCLQMYLCVCHESLLCCISSVQIAVNADGSHSLKLGDFGLAMVVTEPLSLLCGTPSYCAPEMLLETG